MAMKGGWRNTEADRLESSQRDVFYCVCGTLDCKISLDNYVWSVRYCFCTCTLMAPLDQIGRVWRRLNTRQECPQNKIFFSVLQTSVLYHCNYQSLYIGCLSSH